MKKYERIFIILGVMTTMVLTVSAFWLWLKHSLAIVMDDMDDFFGFTDGNTVEPEVVETHSCDAEDDDFYE